MPVYKEVDKDFFKTWTSDMAYALGFFAADGNMLVTKRNTCFISITSSDQDILRKIQKCMRSDHKLSERRTDTGSVYRFQIGSKSIFSDLETLGFSGRKSTRMIMPSIPKGYISDFIRGYFDGDGNVWIGFINKRRQKPTRVLQLTFTSGSRSFLEGLHTLLKTCGILGGSLFSSKSKNFSRLTLSTRDALKLSGIMYNRQPKLYLQRKKLRFDQFRSKKLRS